MQLKFIVIVPVFLILQQAEAVIPNCNYYDTVDISHIQIQNGSYPYNDEFIPASLTGEYDFKELSDGSTKPVKKHLRGCACKVMYCLRFCCSRKNILPNGNCGDGLKEDLSRLTPYLNMTVEDGSTEPMNLAIDLVIQRDQFEICDVVDKLSENEYTFYEDGSLHFRNSYNKRLNKRYYCIYPKFSSDFPKSIWVVRHKCVPKTTPVFKEVGIMSQICYILTILVYLYVKKLRNLFGNCLVCSLFCRLMGNILSFMDIYRISSTKICSVTGYSGYFFKISFHIWLCVISFHMWKGLRSVNKIKTKSRHRFLVYCSFSWGMAAIMTAIIIIIDTIWEDDPDKLMWRPGVGMFECWVNSVGWSGIIYVIGPIAILTIFNVIMFILTTKHMMKVRSELKKFTDNQEKTTQLNSERKSYWQFVRLSVLMGVSYILSVILYLTQKSDLGRIFLLVVSYFHNSFGILVFVLFILKRSTLRLILERIRE